MSLKEKVLWSFFAIIGILAFSNPFTEDIKSAQPLLIIPFLAVILHASWTMSLTRGLLLLIISGVVGFLAEAVGLNYISVFGGQYHYSDMGTVVFEVPLWVIAYWAIFIYTSYAITNSFLMWLGKEKPSLKTAKFSPVLILAIIDSLIVTTIDLFMDPLQVAMGSWSWEQVGPFFGIPIGNFVGWFLVAFLSTAIFRAFEYFNPKKYLLKRGPVYLMPVLAYGLLAVNFTFISIDFNMFTLSIIAGTPMYLLVLANVYLFIKHK